MTYEYWKKTSTIKPFISVEEFEEYEKDLLKLPNLSSFVNTPLHKSKIKKGMTGRGESVDSFWEYIFITYMRQIKGYVVERNHKSFLNYITPDGKQAKFYPDFCCNGIWSEIKGRFTDKDKAKKEQHPEVQWYFSEDIKLMKEELNKKISNWDSDFLQLN